MSAPVGSSPGLPGSRRSPRRWPLLGLLALVPFAAWGDEFFYEPFKLPPVPRPFQYYVNPNSGVSTPPGVQTAVQNAFATWQAVGCAWPRFANQGSTAAIPDVTDWTDPFSVAATFVASGPLYDRIFAGTGQPSAALALTYAGSLSACDIYLNAVDFAWDTASPAVPARVDVESRVLHEIGHCLGLTHDPYDPSENVMSAKSWVGELRRTLTLHDVNHLCGRYEKKSYAAPCNPADSPPCLDGRTCMSADGGTTAGETFCTIACNVPAPGAANPCLFPLVCAASSVFLPDYDGACVPYEDDPGTPAIGRACSVDGDCGSSFGRCILQDTPGPLPPDFPYWQDGYCSTAQGTCDDAPTPCPVGSACVTVEAYDSTTPAGAGVGLRCLQECGDGVGSCRPGYACAQLAGIGGVCVSACHRDEHCAIGDGTFGSCRVCDGVCLERTTSSGRIGDPCQDASDCGIGQGCLDLDDGVGVGVCSQRCDSACTACPDGSSCVSVPLPGGGSSPQCMRDCVPGSCHLGQQCGYVGAGQGCMPECANDGTCPSGYRCISGQCLDPLTTEVPSCALCFNGSGGAAGPGTSDAGVHPPQTGSCGCEAGGAALTAPLLLLLLLGARRRWRHT